MAGIDKKLLEHLASLARFDLSGTDEEKMLVDLGKILNHFAELEELDTVDTSPRTGGTLRVNVLREDGAGMPPLSGARAVEAFPETESGFLKVPAVFTNDA